MNLLTMVEKPKRQTRSKRVGKQSPSKQTEIWYRNKLMAIVSEMEAIAIASFEESTLNDKSDSDNATVLVTMNRKLRRALNRIAETLTDGMALRIARGMTGRANNQNKRQMISSIQKSLGVDITGMLSDDVISSELQLAIEENINLIKSIQDDFKSGLGNIVRNATMGGDRHENLIGEITKNIKQNLSGSQHERAKRIARDQMSKLNADFSRIRNQSLGIELYKWVGVGDGRERETHKAMNDKICRFDDPTVYSEDDGKTWKKRTSSMVHLHPGKDYQCRCQAIPIIKWD